MAVLFLPSTALLLPSSHGLKYDDVVHCVSESGKKRVDDAH